MTKILLKCAGGIVLLLIILALVCTIAIGAKAFKEYKKDKLDCDADVYAGCFFLSIFEIIASLVVLALLFI